MDLNQFYQRFVENLKASRYAELEQLVRENRVEAEKSLGIIRGKIRNENDLQRKDALTMISNELEELIAVTKACKDCALASRIVSRGKQTALPEDGLEIFRRAVKLCPENLDAILGLAELNQRQGNFEEATAAYEKVIALDPNNSDALIGMGEVLYSAGLYERGVPYLEGALKIDPENKKAKKLFESCTKQIALDSGGIIPATEIADRLWSPLEGNLMCMCPSHAKLVARVRFKSITFNTGSVKLNRLAREQLSELAQALNTEALKGGRYLIEGYADPTGAAEYNKTLSGLRAEAVKSYLVDVSKVNPDLLTTSGVGSSRSWTTNDTSVGRRANRRIEIISLGAPDQKSQQR
ncbi:MAG: OmpA family protein [Desulfomonilaceae bacterium]